MIKTYLTMEKGLVETLIFFLKDRLTIGKNPKNDITISDNNLSDYHAEVYLTDQNPVVEDLNSDTGTFVNGERIEKSRLSHNDKLQCGNLTLQLLQEKIPKDQSRTSDKPQTSEAQSSFMSDHRVSSKQSKRLNELIPKIPLFIDLDKDGLFYVIQSARLIVVDSEQIIYKQGDIGSSLYIVLDGNVRVFITDNEGKHIPIAKLTDNEFFGEMSFLSDTPRSATVQAIENTLLCEISANILRSIIYRWPNVRTTLITFYKERLEELENIKHASGMIEQRNFPRYNITIPVGLSPFECILSEKLQNKTFKFLSNDVSMAGIRLMVQDDDIKELPMDCKIEIEIILPKPWKTIRCEGVLKDYIEKKEGESTGYLSVEFLKLDGAEKERLESFLSIS